LCQGHSLRRDRDGRRREEWEFDGDHPWQTLIRTSDRGGGQGRIATRKKNKKRKGEGERLKIKKYKGDEISWQRGGGLLVGRGM